VSSDRYHGRPLKIQFFSVCLHIAYTMPGYTALCMISPCSGARPLPAQISKAPASMEINHRKYDEHDEHNQQTNESLHQKLQLDLSHLMLWGRAGPANPFSPCYPKGPFLPQGLPLLRTALRMQSQLRSLPIALQIIHDLLLMRSWIQIPEWDLCTYNQRLFFSHFINSL